MTRQNYEDMKHGKVTKVYIPFEPLTSSYSVPVTAVLIHYQPVVGCIIETPFESHVVQREKPVSFYASTMVYRVTGSLLGKSGLYTYTCSGRKQDVVAGVRMRETLSVSLFLKFVRGLPILTIDIIFMQLQNAFGKRVAIYLPLQRHCRDCSVVWL